MAHSGVPVARSSIGYGSSPSSVPVQPLPAQPVPAERLQYEPAPAAYRADPSELVREFYVPAGMLVFGLVAMLGWLAYHGTFFIAAIIILMFVVAIGMILKTAALSLLAWYQTGQSGGTMGNPLSMILKTAALVVTLDAAVLWTWSGMIAVGAIAPVGRLYPLTLIVVVLVQVLGAAVISQLVYGLSGHQANVFCRHIAGGNVVINGVVLVLLIVVFHPVATGLRRPRTPALAPTRVVAPAAAPGTTAVITSPTDRRIESRLAHGGVAIMEGEEWKTSIQFRKADRPVGKLIDQLYNAGAAKVLVDQTSGSRRVAGGPAVYVELPDDSRQRAACLGVVAVFEKASPRSRISPSSPTTERFIEVDAAAR